MNPSMKSADAARSARGVPASACISVGLVALLAGCAADPIRTYSYLGPGYSFEQQRGTRYAWTTEQLVAENDPQADFASVRKIFRESVDAELSRKGFSRTGDAKPDFLLTYELGRRTVGDPYAPAEDHHFALINLDVQHPETRKLIWRAAAQVEFDRTAKPDEIRDLVNRTVVRMLAPVKPRTGAAGP